MDEQDFQNKIKARDRRNNIIVITLSVVLVALGILYFM